VERLIGSFPGFRILFRMTVDLEKRLREFRTSAAGAHASVEGRRLWQISTTAGGNPTAEAAILQRTGPAVAGNPWIHWSNSGNDSVFSFVAWGFLRGDAPSGGLRIPGFFLLPCCCC